MHVLVFLTLAVAEGSGPPGEASFASSVDCDLRASLVPPSSQPYELNLHGRVGSRGYTVRTVLDMWVDKALNGSKGLFAVESGASDGEEGSNTLFLEVKRGWQCLLVEPNPFSAMEMLAKRRKCHVLRGGLALTGAPGTFDFAVRGKLGGVLGTISPQSRFIWRAHLHELRKQMRGPTWKRNLSLESRAMRGSVMKVCCFPVNAVLRAMDRRTVDYWSLDTEGSEPHILESTDFSSLEVGVLSVEHQEEAPRRERIRDVLHRNGFALVDTLLFGEDLWASPVYFRKRGLPFPRKLAEYGIAFRSPVL